MSRSLSVHQSINSDNYEYAISLAQSPISGVGITPLSRRSENHSGSHSVAKRRSVITLHCHLFFTIYTQLWQAKYTTIQKTWLTADKHTNFIDRKSRVFAAKVGFSTDEVGFSVKMWVSHSKEWIFRPKSWFLVEKVKFLDQ